MHALQILLKNFLKSSIIISLFLSIPILYSSHVKKTKKMWLEKGGCREPQY